MLETKIEELKQRYGENVEEAHWRVGEKMDGWKEKLKEAKREVENEAASKAYWKADALVNEASKGYIKVSSDFEELDEVVERLKENERCECDCEPCVRALNGDLSYHLHCSSVRCCPSYQSS